MDLLPLCPMLILSLDVLRVLWVERLWAISFFSFVFWSIFPIQRLDLPFFLDWPTIFNHRIALKVRCCSTWVLFLDFFRTHFWNNRSIFLWVYFDFPRWSLPVKYRYFAFIRLIFYPLSFVWPRPSFLEIPFCFISSDDCVTFSSRGSIRESVSDLVFPFDKLDMITKMAFWT